MRTARIFSLAALMMFAGVAATRAAYAATAAPAASAASASEARGVTLPPVREVRLPNGALLVLAEKHDVPLIAFQAWVRGGSISDPPGKEGVAALTGDLLRKGAGRRSARDIAIAADGVGGAFGTGGGLQASWVSGEFMSRDQKLMLELLTDVLRKPTFPDSEFQKLKEQTIESFAAAKDEPNSIIGQYGAAAVFADHPYGRPAAGDEATVATITREDVLRSYRDQFGGDRLILVMVGDFKAGSMEGLLRRAFGTWPKAAAAATPVAAPRRVAGRRVLLIDKPDALQTYFWIGNVGIARTDPDRDAIGVANTGFGGQYTSLLNTALRIKSGLTYGARSHFATHAQAGSFSMSSYTKTDSTQRAIDLALETYRAFRSNGLDARAFAASKKYIQGQFPTEVETGDQIAGIMADLAFYGLPPEEITGFNQRIAAVNSDAARLAISRAFPPPEDLTMVLIGNASKIRAMAGRYGTVSEAPITDPILSAVRSARPAAR